VKTTECVEGHHEARKVPSGRRHIREDGYSWLDSYLDRFEGKEARHEYYARLAGPES
jgi:hypothetical protein